LSGRPSRAFLENTNSVRRSFFYNAILLITLICCLPITSPAQKRPKEIIPEQPTQVISAGKLVIYSAQSVASIFLNGQAQGKYLPNTKLSKPIDLKPGSYLLTIEHADYSSFSMKINMNQVNYYQCQ